jgi:hypothetical protein
MLHRLWSRALEAPLVRVSSRTNSVSASLSVVAKTLALHLLREIRTFRVELRQGK